MLHYITQIVRITDEYAVICRFSSGEKRKVLLKPLLEQLGETPEIQQLWDVHTFQTVSLDSYGALIWANGVDFCPEVLYKHSEPAG